LDLEFWVSGFEFWVSGFEFWVTSFEFRVAGKIELTVFIGYLNIILIP